MLVLRRTIEEHGLDRTWSWNHSRCRRWGTAAAASSPPSPRPRLPDRGAAAGGPGSFPEDRAESYRAHGLVDDDDGATVIDLGLDPDPDDARRLWEL